MYVVVFIGTDTVYAQTCLGGCNVYGHMRACCANIFPLSRLMHEFYACLVMLR